MKGKETRYPQKACSLHSYMPLPLVSPPLFSFGSKRPRLQQSGPLRETWWPFSRVSCFLFFFKRDNVKDCSKSRRFTLLQPSVQTIWTFWMASRSERESTSKEEPRFYYKDAKKQYIYSWGCREWSSLVSHNRWDTKLERDVRMCQGPLLHVWQSLTWHPYDFGKNGSFFGTLRARDFQS